MILNPYLLHILTFLSYIHNALSNSLFFLLCSSVPPTGACELACNGLIDPLHWLAGSEVTSATKTRATLHTSCLVVSSHHYTTNILSHTVISTSTPSKSESPPLQIIQHPSLLQSIPQGRSPCGRVSSHARGRGDGLISKSH